MLELRRKDNGSRRIQWWSARYGKFTRTMFVDITERVLMEQEKRLRKRRTLPFQEEIRNEQ